MKQNSALVGILMGSDSDLPVMQEAAKVLAEFGVGYELTIVSAHRTPDRLMHYGKNALDWGLKVIIAGAGGAAHLPGMVAAVTTLPVIGVPIQSKTMNGLDSLYSIVQMPTGVPVATVAINSARNAGLLALEILGTADEKIEAQLIKYKDLLKQSVLEKARELEKLGYKKYLSQKKT